MKQISDDNNSEEKKKCFELEYICPFPDRRDPSWCYTCTQVMINIYHIKNYALTTITAVKKAFEDFDLKKAGTVPPPLTDVI